MNISTPTVKNTGFFSKAVQATYREPEFSCQKLGVLPEAQPYDSVEHTKDRVFPPVDARDDDGNFANVKERNPILDQNSAPVMKEVTRWFEVPGPKGEAVSEVFSSTLLGGLAFAAPGLGIGVLGMAGMLLNVISGGGAPGGSDMFEFGAKVAMGGGALGGALGLGLGLNKAIPMWNKTNSLTWSEEPIESKKMTGMKFTGSAPGRETRVARFEPVIEKTEVGRWTAPKLDVVMAGL